MRSCLILYIGFVGVFLGVSCSADHRKENEAMGIKNLTPKSLRLAEDRSCGPLKSDKISYDVCQMIQRHDADTEFQVLVVIDAPQPNVSAFLEPNVDWANAKPSLPDEGAIQKMRITVETKLKSFGEPKPRWLNNAQAFVADLDAYEMGKLAEMPEVLEIVPNARLR